MTHKLKNRMLFEFPADVKHVREVREYTYKASLDMGFSPNEALLLVTAVWEATLNAATHGSPNGHNDRVRVVVSHDKDLLKVDITSSNRAFQLAEDGPKLNPAGTRGRGLPIIFTFMDDVALTDDEDGVTLHMVKRLQKDGKHQTAKSS